MLGAVYHGALDVRVETIAKPAGPGPGELLLRVLRASVCGTDVAEYRDGPHLVPLHRTHPASGHVGPVVLGHEVFGEVLAVGEGITGFRIGDRVVPGSGVSCGGCDPCRTGRTNLCRSYWTIGLHRDGGLCEQIRVPAPMCRHVPADCPDDVAVMAQPLAVALHAVQRARIAPGATVAVYGAGGIGMFGLAALARQEVRVLVVDISPSRLRVAHELGADVCLDAARDDPAAAVLHHTDGIGADVVIEASGSAAGLHNAARCVRAGGNLHLVGLYGDAATMPLTSLVLDEVDITTSKVHNCAVALPAAIDLLAGSPGWWSRLIGESLTLPQVVTHGFERLARGELQRKVVVRQE